MSIRRSLIVSLVLLCLGTATALAAQTPILVSSTSSLAWDVPGVPDAATAQALSFTVTVDAGTPVALTGVTCSVVTAPTVTCKVPVSVIPVGSHTVVVSDSSGSSAPYAYVDWIVLVPVNVRVQP